MSFTTGGNKMSNVHNYKIKDWKVEIVRVPKSGNDRAWIEGWIVKDDRKYQFLLTKSGKISWSSENIPEYVKEFIKSKIKGVE